MLRNTCKTDTTHAGPLKMIKNYAIFFFRGGVWARDYALYLKELHDLEKVKNLITCGSSDHVKCHWFVRTHISSEKRPVMRFPYYNNNNNNKKSIVNRNTRGKSERVVYDLDD